MREFDDIREQVLNGVFITFWLLTRPFVWLFNLAHWLFVAIAKETGNKIAKIVGGALAISILGVIVQLISSAKF